MMHPNNKKKKIWKEEKERLLRLSRADRRKELDKHYVSLDDIPTLLQEMRKASNEDENQEINPLCEKVSLYKGDLTQLEVDVIVNAANTSLLGGGGVDGCIHRASGSLLYDECRMLGGCATGQAKITCGYKLPAKYVIHTVGPIARGQLSQRHEEDLASCYKSSLALAKEHKIRSIAFPCISTGIYGFPNEPAAKIAMETTKEWLKVNQDEIDRIIFCVFLEIDYKIYKKKLVEFFPKDAGDDDDDEKDDTKEGNKDIVKETAIEKDLKLPIQESGDTEDTQDSGSVSEDTEERKDHGTGTEKSMVSPTVLDVPEVDMMETSPEKEDPGEEGLKTDIEMSHASQVANAETVTEVEIRPEAETSAESQEQSENNLIPEESQNLSEDEQNDSDHDDQKSFQISNASDQLDSEPVPDDVHMQSQNIDSQTEEHGENTDVSEK